MQNCYNIVTLCPFSYNKKSLKSTNVKELNNFISKFQKKLTEWEFTCSFPSKCAEAYKLNYHQFEKSFNPEFNLILYIICSSSVESFRKSIKKLICTCDSKEKLQHIVVISFDDNEYPELNDTLIDVVQVGNIDDGCDDSSYWTNLKEKMTAKLQTIRDKTADQTNTDCLTLPKPIPHQKSPSKLRRFLHNIHDHETKKTSKKNSPVDLSVDNLHEPQSSGHNHRDNSKYSFNSLFKKRSPKTRDSGLSMSSHTSSWSDSKESDTICEDKSKSTDVGLDAMSDVSQSSEKNSIFCSSSLEKPKMSKHRNQHHTTKTLFGATCLSSPEIKHKNNFQNAFSGFTLFTNILVTATSDTIVTESPEREDNDELTFRRGQRCISEPPFRGDNSTENCQMNDAFKYHFWDSDMVKEEELRTYDLTFRKPDNIEITLKPMIYEGISTTNKPEVNVYNVQQSSIPVSNMATLDNEKNTDISNLNDIDHHYFQLQYAASNEDRSPITLSSSGLRATYSPFKLTTISEDIQKVHSGKSNEGHHFSTFKVVGEKRSESVEEKSNTVNQSEVEEATIKEYRQISTVLTQEGNMVEDTYNNADLVITSQCHTPKHLNTETSESLVTIANSYSNTQEHSLINNPIVVGGLFAVAALTAPMWSTYIPQCTEVGTMVYSTVRHILNNDMVQHIPNGLVSTTRQGTVTVAKSLGHLVYRTANHGNLFFH